MIDRQCARNLTFRFALQENESSNPVWTNTNWLKSRFHFSFAEYSSRHNTNFGVLRVMNDDLVQPARGFGMHPHRDVEICTYVVEGQLTHADSMGTQETLGPGSIQFMTAGHGVHHSEHNHAPESPLRFVQMWLTPRQQGLQPNYGSFSPALETPEHNVVKHLVSDVQDTAADTPVKINTDTNIFVATVTPREHVEIPIKGSRQAYLLCVEGNGTLTLDGKCAELCQHDAAEIHSEGPLKVEAGAGGVHVLVVEMAKDSAGGRTDLPF